MVLALLLGLSLQVVQDTSVTLRPGDRVVIENLIGEISVGSWERDELEVRDEDGRGSVSVRRSGATVMITPDHRRGARSTRVSVRMPRWADVSVGSRALDVWVERMDGVVDVDNVRGDVWIEDAGGPVRVRTIAGEIDVARATAGVVASSQSDDVRLREVAGRVDAHSGNGDVLLADIRSSSVRAETQNGDVAFSGTIEDDGSYGFYVHDGDVTVAVQEGANARVRVSTFDGDFESDFPVVIERFTGGREFNFAIGEPRASIVIQVFDGEIRLRRR